MSATLSELVKELSVTHYVLTELKSAALISIPKYRDVLEKMQNAHDLMRTQEEVALLGESIEFYKKLLDSLESFSPDQSTIDNIEKILIVADSASKGPNSSKEGLN